jgi:thiosulfate/3-mercaptopyruvate sulfurtransferase
MEIYGHDTNKLKLLNGGLVNWKKLGYPTLDGHIPVSATKYKVEKINPILLTWSDIFRDVVSGARPEVLLVDVRPADEYSAKNIRAIRGGHIPHAINVTGTDANNKEDHTFKSTDEIKKLFEAKGITSDKFIYEYCHSGDRTAHAYIILKYILGYKDVKVYDGSWIEWATLLSLPAEDQVWYTEKK